MDQYTKIILVRHGQSLGNATKTILGHTDLDMSEHGYKQAEATAEYLKNEIIDVIYSSDLKRAVNTALPHANMRGLKLHTSEKLREIYVGAWENLKTDDILAKWGREIFENDWLGNFGTFTFPEGESTLEGGRRFFTEMERICREYPGKTVLVAAHAAVIRSFWGIISNISPENLAKELPFSTNASFSIAHYDGNRFIPIEYSHDEHLKEVGITSVKLI